MQKRLAKTREAKRQAAAVHLSLPRPKSPVRLQPTPIKKDGGAMNSILLADDETVICAELARTVEDPGFKIEVAPTVESSLAYAEAAQFDAILVEVNFQSERSAHPRTGNGLQVVRQLRALEVTAPVLMFTAMKGELYETASLDAGADNFILKTTSIPSLISRLRAHIRRHQQSLGESPSR
jgi:DNA-binding response OmpR family regulator